MMDVYTQSLLADIQILLSISHALGMAELACDSFEMSESEKQDLVCLIAQGEQQIEQRKTALRVALSKLIQRAKLHEPKTNT